MVKMTFMRSLVAAAFLLTAVWGTAVRVSAESKEEDMPERIGAESVCICELTTGQHICERDADKVLPMGHMAKLMTVLICAEELEKGTVGLEDEVTASANANLCPSPQIWLESGDRITVEELLKAITMGNANDACVALAEKLSGSVEKHTERMNARSKALGMNDTHFSDCSGLAEETVSTANDMCILAEELIKYNCLTKYFTTWIDNIKRQDVELVNTNRLVRNYKGTIGFKFCSGNDGKCSLITAAKRENMSACIILLEGTGKDDMFNTASKLLDDTFERYRVYQPEIEDELFNDISVVNGKKKSVGVKLNNFKGILVRKEVLSKIKFRSEVSASVAAPVTEGEELGCIVYTLDGVDILDVKICAAETVEKMDIFYAIYCCLCNLCNI